MRTGGTEPGASGEPITQLHDACPGTPCNGSETVMVNLGPYVIQVDTTGGEFFVSGDWSEEELWFTARRIPHGQGCELVLDPDPYGSSTFTKDITSQLAAVLGPAAGCEVHEIVEVTVGGIHIQETYLVDVTEVEGVQAVLGVDVNYDYCN